MEQTEEAKATAAAKALVARRKTATYTCAVCGREFIGRVKVGHRHGEDVPLERTCSPTCRYKLYVRHHPEKRGPGSRRAAGRAGDGVSEQRATKPALDAFEAGHQSRKRSREWAHDTSRDLLNWFRDRYPDDYREFWRGYYYPHDDVDSD